MLLSVFKLTALVAVLGAGAIGAAEAQGTFAPPLPPPGALPTVAPNAVPGPPPDTVGAPIEPALSVDVTPIPPPSAPVVVAPPVAQKGPPLGMFTLRIAGTPVETPFVKSHCNLDPENAKDRDLLDALSKFSGKGSTVVASTIDCAGQQLTRAGNIGPVDLVLYVARDKQSDAPIDRRDFVRRACEVLMQGRNQPVLRGSTTKEKADELYALGVASPQGAAAVLDATNRACYYGFAQAVDPARDAKLAMVIGATVIRGRLMTIIGASINRANVVQMRNRVGRLIETMSKANGDG